MAKKRSVEPLKIAMVLIPKIEQVLDADITDYEKVVLIKKHIENWRKK